MAAVIEVRDLVKRYRKGTVNAVDGVSFDVEQGQFFALLGPNGAGKTTTISILTTTLGLTSGSVRIGPGRAIAPASLCPDWEFLGYHGTLWSSIDSSARRFAAEHASCGY